MSFWRGWSISGATAAKPKLSRNPTPTPSPTGTALPHASAQTKADLQEIINKHQAAALLEANQSIRDLQQEREDFIDRIQAQERIIQAFKEEFTNCKVAEVASGSGNHATDADADAQIRELKRQLKEKDAIIENLQLKSSSHTALKGTIVTLEEKVKEQQDEIDRLQSVLREIETFHIMTNGTTESEADSLADYSSNDSQEEDPEEGLVEVQEGSVTIYQSPQMQPNQRMTLNGNQLVLLISTMSANNTIKSNQKRLETILQGLQLSAEEVQVLDGCDPTSLNLRNDLFAISGKHAKYPQLFLVNFQQNDIHFVGDYETITDLHDSQMLESVVGLMAL